MRVLQSSGHLGSEILRRDGGISLQWEPGLNNVARRILGMIGGDNAGNAGGGYGLAERVCGAVGGRVGPDEEPSHVRVERGEEVLVVKSPGGGVEGMRGRSWTVRSMPGLGMPVGTREKNREGFETVEILDRGRGDVCR